MSEVEWSRLEAHELRELANRGAAVVIPVAAMEQHGPHLPVRADSRLATEVSLRAARKAFPKRPTVVLPVVWCALFEHHMPSGGTITWDHQTLHALFRCIADSVRRHGFSNLLQAASDAIAALLTDAQTWAPAADLRGNATGDVPFVR